VGFLLLPALALVALRVLDRAPATAESSGRVAQLAISLGQALSVAGGFQLVRLLLTHSTWTIDGMELFGVSLVGGALLGGALVAVGARSTGQRGLKGFLVLAVFGALSASLTLLRDLNIDLDFHPGVTREVRILDLERSTTLRGGTSYFVRLADWTHEGRARDYDISRRQFHGFAIGQIVAFEEHPGALGFRWLGNLRPVP
jgi:hypothetical protein